MAGAVAIGGALGALARAGIELAVGVGGDAFAWPVLLVNVLGSFALGALSVLALARRAPQWVGPALGTGFLGGFTTFSAYVVGAEVMLGSGAALLALGYALLTPVLCVAAAALGTQTVRLVHGSPGPGRPAQR